jgi:hypothetical protein
MLAVAHHDETGIQVASSLYDLANGVAMPNMHPDTQALQPAHRRSLFRDVSPQLTSELTNARLGSVAAHHIHEVDGGARNMLCQMRCLLESVAASFG